MNVPNLAEFYLTDGTTYINLLSRQNGFAVEEWRPLTPEPKGGGIWQESALSEGRRLVAQKRSNVLESLSLAGRGGTADLLIVESQRIRRLLENAVAYWTTEWQDVPVYFFTRGINESNIRYALIYDYRAPGDGNPFASPFVGPDASIFAAWPLVLERGQWQDVAPGDSTCVALSGSGTFAPKTDFSPSETGDDAYTLAPATISTAGTNLIFGKSAAGNAYDLGVRFQAVPVPNGATITRAFISFISTNNDSGGAVNARVYGEDADSAAVFSTYADFQGRTRTTAYASWNLIPIWHVGETYPTPDLTDIIQEIVDRAGWASGNDLVLFVEDYSSSNSAIRRAASYDNAGYTEPVLTLVYEEGTLGQEATCEKEVFVANKRNEANLTDVYYYDASLATFSANLMSAVLPTALLPAVPAVDDIIYYIVDSSLADSGPFASVVHDILAEQTGITGVAYEYWNGAWVTVTVQDNTSSDGVAFSVTGVNGMHWSQPSDWTTTTINGVTGYIMRIRVTSITGTPTPPTQQNRYPYSVTWPYVELDAAQVPGDIAALIRAFIYNESDGTQGSSGLTINVNRVIMASRSTSRGTLFTPFLNISDEQNPAGVLVSVGTNTTFSADVTSVTGRVALYNPTAAESMATRATVALDDTLTPSYRGRFRLYARYKQSGGNSGDMSAQIVVCLNSENVTIYTSPVRTVPNGSFGVLDFGEVTIPPHPRGLKSTDTFLQYLFLLQASSLSGTPNLHFMDLILFPSDEFIYDFQGEALTDAMLGNFSDNRLLEVDSATRPRALITALLSEQGTGNELNFYTPITSSPLSLQANVTQRVYFLSENTPLTTSWVATAFRIQMWRISRYLSMRGNQ